MTSGPRLMAARLTRPRKQTKPRTAHTQPAMKPVRGRSRSSFPVRIFGDLANDLPCPRLRLNAFHSQTTCAKLGLNAVGADKVVQTDDNHRWFWLSEHGPDLGNPSPIPRDR
jgi:hypothetical protein